MRYVSFKKYPFPLVLALLVASTLVFAGMRVPDTSRPHRPKATHRAVLENPVKASAFAVKKALDHVAIVAVTCGAAAPVSQCSLSSRTTRPLVSDLHPPRKSRSPPSSFGFI